LQITTFIKSRNRHVKRASQSARAGFVARFVVMIARFAPCEARFATSPLPAAGRWPMLA
jgi:hypothetical protein